MVLYDQSNPYNIMYVWAAFEAKSPPTRQDFVTIALSSNSYEYIYLFAIFFSETYVLIVLCVKKHL